MKFHALDHVLYGETVSGKEVKIGDLYTVHSRCTVPEGEFRQIENTRFFVFHNPETGLIVLECDVTEDLAELKVYEESRLASS